MKLLDMLETKRTLILGLGREGISTLLFLRKRFPQKPLVVADRRPWTQLDQQTRQIIESDSFVTCCLGEEYLNAVADSEVICKSPGIYPATLMGIRRPDSILTSNTALFMECCPGKIIGVTGTKGKSTTTALIYTVLQAAGLPVRLTGNIGIPPLSTLDEATSTALFVTELSSYQLADLYTSPHIAVLQNIVPEHLDYHGDFAAYRYAKQNITHYQSSDDYLIFNAGYPIPTEIAHRSQAQPIPFNFQSITSAGCYVDQNSLMYCRDGYCEPVIAVKDVSLKGTFNLQNVMPCIVVGKLLGIPTEVIATAIRGFQPLEHRLELVQIWNEVAFYNDSLSTVPEAAICAMQAFPQKRLILLAGGYDRGLDFTELARAILNHQIKAMILFPTTGERIWQEVITHAKDVEQLPEHFFVTTMSEAVSRAYSIASQGDTVLLSPASPSFNTFQDYRDRGNQFKTAISILTGGTL